MPLVGCSGLLPSLLPNWLEEVQILAEIAILIVNFWALYFGRLSMKLKNLEVFVRYTSKMTILDEIYLSQIRMTACKTFTDAVSKVGLYPLGVDFICWPALCEGIPTPSSITISVFPPPPLPPPSSGHWRPRIRSDTRYCFGSLLRLRCTQSLPPSPSLFTSAHLRPLRYQCTPIAG